MPMVAVTQKADRLRGRTDRCPDGIVQRETREARGTARPAAELADLAAGRSS
jgi:hypothetical protein